MRYNQKQLRRYLGFTFGFAWLIQIVASFLAIRGNTPVFTVMLAVSMFMPLVGALLSGASVRTVGWKPLFRNRIRYIFLALLLPLAATMLGAALYFLVRPGAFDLSGDTLRLKLGEAAFAQLQSSGITPAILVGISLVQSITYAPFLNMFFAIGEEAGWRGVMLPMLTERFGFIKGQLLGGVIWGAWHFPIIMIAGYEYGLPLWMFPLPCVLGCVVFCIFTTAWSIILDHLYRSAGHIWIPALAHGAINALATIPSIVTSLSYANETILGPAPVGIIAVIPLAVTACILLLHKREKQA